MDIQQIYQDYQGNQLINLGLEQKADIIKTLEAQIITLKFERDSLEKYIYPGSSIKWSFITGAADIFYYTTVLQAVYSANIDGYTSTGLMYFKNSFKNILSSDLRVDQKIPLLGVLISPVLVLRTLYQLRNSFNQVLQSFQSREKRLSQINTEIALAGSIIESLENNQTDQA
jgi:hypothetical protein